MQQNQNGNSGTIMIVALVASITYFAFLFAIFCFAMASLLFTCWCFSAWNRPKRYGKVLITPDMARTFVKRGLWGIFLLPVFVFSFAVFTGININADAWRYLPIIGYALGSLGLDLLLGDETEAAPAVSQLPVIAPQPPALSPGADAPKNGQPGQPDPTFRFASWDDEEELRR